MTEGIFFLLIFTALIWPFIDYFAIQMFDEVKWRGRLFAILWILSGFGFLWLIPVVVDKSWANNAFVISASLQVAAVFLSLLRSFGKKRNWVWLDEVFLFIGKVGGWLIAIWGFSQPGYMPRSYGRKRKKDKPGESK